MGFPAARIGDMHLCPMVAPGPCPHVGGPIIQGSPNVITGGMPQARVGDKAICCCPPDTIAAGSSGVLVNNKPAARLTDSTVHGGKIIVGCPTVLIGGGGGGGGQSAGAKGGAITTKVKAGADVGGSVDMNSLRNAQAKALKQAQQRGQPFCETCNR